MRKLRIGIGLGDRNGIGPEIVARLLATPELSEEAEIVVVGHPAVLEFGRVAAGVEYAFGFSVAEHTAFAHSGMGTGKADARAGAEAVDQIAVLLDGARKGEIDGIVLGPVNKEAMLLGGLKESDELYSVVEQIVKFQSGVTVLAGLPVPTTTVGHGTAYDIAGKGRAHPHALVEAFRICCKLASAKGASPKSVSPL